MLPNPDYMSSQKELAWPMRGVLPDWLVQIHALLRLLPETFFLCQHHRPLLIGVGRVACQAPAGRHYVPLHRLQGRGNTGLLRVPLPSLRRFLVHWVRDHPRRALRTRLELVIPKPNTLPPSYQQLRRQSSNHRQVPLGVRDTRMAFIGYSSVLDGRCFVLDSSFDSQKL